MTTTYDFADERAGLEYLHNVRSRGLAIPLEELLRAGAWEFSSSSDHGDTATTRYEIVKK